MPPDDNPSEHAEPKYTSEQEAVLTALDPELQRVVLALRRGQLLPPYLLEKIKVGDETKQAVDVIARLRNPNMKVPGLWVVRKIGRIVTGLVEADRITEVRGHRNVLSLKAARRLRKMLRDSVPEINASPENLAAKLPSGNPVPDGSGVIVGIVDHGCDFSHPNFRKRDAAGSTRVLFLWDQRGGRTNLSPRRYGYGREFTAKMIDRVLANRPANDEPDGPHKRLGYLIQAASHGTRVMDVAVGSGAVGNGAGVAPGADIIFVDASLGDFDDSESAGNSRHLLEAVTYIFEKAATLGRPAVVNISLNFDSGPHDGSTPVEEGFDHLLEIPGRAIVIAAGNSRRDQVHVQRTVRPGLTRTLLWRIPEDDPTPNKLEIWYDGRHRVEVTLRSPDGQTLGPFGPDQTHTIYADGNVAGWVFNRVRDPANRDNQIVLLFGPGIADGVWKVDLRAVGGGPRLPFDVHAWVEKDEDMNSAPSGLEDTLPSDLSYTVGTIACGNSTIAVGGYGKLLPKLNMISSSEGPTRDGKLKPEVSAPGVGTGNVDLVVADGLSASAKPTTGGTSIAAPHVTGLVALLMDAAFKDAGRLLTIEEIRELVIGAAQHSPPLDRHAWDTCYGAGRVDAAKSIQALLNILAQARETDLVIEESTAFVAAAFSSVGTAGLGVESGGSELVALAATTEVTTTEVTSVSSSSGAPVAEEEEEQPEELPHPLGH